MKQMATLKIPKLYAYYTANQTAIELNASTISEALTALYIIHPPIQKHLVDQKGNLRRHINLFVNKVNIKELRQLDTPLSEKDEVVILPNISGG